MAKGTRDSGLGRGLSALLGEAALEPEQQGVTRLPIEKVQPNGAQPRKFFPPESISDLADSIRIHGIHPAADSAPSVLRLLPDHCR